MERETQSYCVFDTAIGACAIAWSAHGVTRLRLPEQDRAAIERRLQRRGASASDAAPAAIARVIAQVQDYIRGRAVDFSSALLDLTGVGEFEQAVYAAARRIPWGETRSYGELAVELGAPEGARAVGQALGRNPVPIIVPCHRILAKGHRAGGFSAPGGIFTKQQLLALEGVRIETPTPLLPGIAWEQQPRPARPHR
jgi:methylated-DNA-[protein]-cysteine S-methyltransferase